VAIENRRHETESQRWHGPKGGQEMGYREPLHTSSRIALRMLLGASIFSLYAATAQAQQPG
jgi:hypothetical protein